MGMLEEKKEEKEEKEEDVSFVNMAAERVWGWAADEQGVGQEQGQAGIVTEAQVHMYPEGHQQEQRQEEQEQEERQQKEEQKMLQKEEEQQQGQKEQGQVQGLAAEAQGQAQQQGEVESTVAAAPDGR